MFYSLFKRECAVITLMQALIWRSLDKALHGYSNYTQLLSFSEYYTDYGVYIRLFHF